jgi:erythromycin esterase-like protein
VSASTLIESSQELAKCKREIERLNDVIQRQQEEMAIMAEETMMVKQGSKQGNQTDRDGLGFVGSQRMQSMVSELRTLRETTADQAEQIEVCVYLFLCM